MRASSQVTSKVSSALTSSLSTNLSVPTSTMVSNHLLPFLDQIPISTSYRTFSHRCVKMIDLTYFDWFHPTLSGPENVTPKTGVHSSQGKRFNFSAMPAMLWLCWKGQQMVNPPGPLSMALCFFVSTEQNPFSFQRSLHHPHPPTRLHGALLAQAKMSWHSSLQAFEQGQRSLK